MSTAALLAPPVDAADLDCSDPIDVLSAWANRHRVTRVRVEKSDGTCTIGDLVMSTVPWRNAHSWVFVDTEQGAFTVADRLPGEISGVANPLVTRLCAA